MGNVVGIKPEDVPIPDVELLAGLIANEAGGQPHEGKVAVARVVMNRGRLKFFSDGTIKGTITHNMQFSGLWCDWVPQHGYQRIIWTEAGAYARLAALIAHYKLQPGLWRDCVLAAQQGMGTEPFSGGPEYEKLSGDTVNYFNPKLAAPPWGTPDKFVCAIFDHAFYRA